MITLKPTVMRMILLAPILALLAVIFSFQDQSQETVYVTTKKSRPFEMAACDLKKMDPLCEQLGNMNEEDFEIGAGSDGYAVLQIQPPTPCPKGHCIPFLMRPRVCFHSEADERPVEIYVNKKRIGKATNVSYDPKQKLRTVYFDGKKNLEMTGANGKNVLEMRIPVTYGSKKIILVATSRF